MVEREARREAEERLRQLQSDTHQLQADVMVERVARREAKKRLARCELRLLELEQNATTVQQDRQLDDRLLWKKETSGPFGGGVPRMTVDGNGICTSNQESESDERCSSTHGGRKSGRSADVTANPFERGRAGARLPSAGERGQSRSRKHRGISPPKPRRFRRSKQLQRRK